METTDIILLAQPTLWMLAILMALWVFVEALNASLANEWRIRLLSEVTALSMIGFAGLGAYYFGLFHAAVPATAAKTGWPWDRFAAEAKEHLVFVPIVLALYLPIVARTSLSRTPSARAVVMVTAAFIVLGGLAIEGAGKLADFNAAKAATSQGAQK